MPTAAYRYCEALRIASAFGWYIFPPMTFYLQWDGADIAWRHEGMEPDLWQPLTEEHFPGLPADFDIHAPSDIKGFAPPFIGRTVHPGIVQIWSGLFFKTMKGWSSLVRPPPNLPRSKHYECFEGVIESDAWLGPLFTNIRLTTTNYPIEFNCEYPLFTVQPLLRETYCEEALARFEIVHGLSDISAEDWAEYSRTIVSPNTDSNRHVGGYAAKVRRRAKRPST